MSAYIPKDWSPETFAALNPRIRADMDRPALEEGTSFPERFAAIQKAHRAVFALGADLLAQYGHAGYFHQSGTHDYIRDPLTTGYLAAGDTLHVTYGDETGLCIPAIRVSVEQPGDKKNLAKLPLMDRLTKSQPEQTRAKAAMIKRHVGTLTVQAALLSTRKEDIDPHNDAARWCRPVRERAAHNPILEAGSKVWYNGTYASRHSYIDEALKKPDVAMWRIQLPDLIALNHTYDNLYVRRNLLPDSAPNSVTGVYDQIGEADYAGQESKVPALKRIADLLIRADDIAQPVRGLGLAVRQPVPSIT